MDNQQTKVEDTEIAWFAGFIDGEGSLCMMRTNAGKYKVNGEPVGGFVPRLTICNTDFPTLGVVCDIADRLGLPYHIYTDLRLKEKGHRPTHKPRWHFSCQGLKRMTRWLVIIFPYLKTKRERAELLLEYCISRSKRRRNEPLSKREREILNLFRNPDVSQRLNASKGGGQNSSPTEWYSPSLRETVRATQK